MAIFQKSVIKKHLKNLNKDQVEKAYLKLKSNYNLAKIEQIKTLKEEEYQDGFLRDIFVDVFGYTLRPDENYNLHREFKNQSDGKKADGAILIDGKAIAVIELKSTKTKDLTKVTQQAFNYKNNQPECKYVITSNFQKLRFYIDYANEYEEFDLFNLGKEDFELLYLLLNKKSIFDNLPLKLKEETKFHEQEVSSKLYKDYSHFKRKLYENLTKNHPESDKLTLFKKSQKLLDRFLFILFAEDSGLLPPNSISRVIETYYKLIELDAQKPLYDIFKQYFGYMNIGRKGKTNSDDIPAYNGGLFYTDDVLDNLKIDDKILIDDLLNLSEYDFSTEVDVNILGHIFEHSLNEIEEITAEIESTTITTRGLIPLQNNKTSKRKKDGVFYTPKYITQYIVENTIGTLCNEKRIALNIEEIEFDGSFRTKTGKLSEKGKKLYNKLKEYKDWLISLKIIDPACGSGAFLNQALNFLIKEHTIIDDIIAELTNTPLRLFDVDKSILENNLFGVDINEESVEIAQLSLWLRTAQKGRKLSNLNNNIKCGNSLIDDPEIAGDKAFNWNTEFKEIMGNGGFDCVIGNPPYFNIQTLGAKSKIAQSIQNSYPEIWQDKSDILFYFIAKAIDISKNSIGFIVSNAFMFSDKAKKLRNYILENAPIEKIINFEKYMVFQDASITTNIIKLNKNKKDTTCLAYAFKEKKYTQEFVSQTINNTNKYFKVNLKKDKVFALVETEIANLNEKIDSNYQELRELFKIGKGMETAANKQFLFKEYPSKFPKEFIKKRMSGEIINKYHIDKIKEYILYFEQVENFEDLPKAIQNHLIENKAFLENRATVKNEGRIWWRYSRPMHKDYYHLDKIWCSYRAKENIFCFDNTKEYIGLTNTTVIFDTNNEINLKYLIALLNSSTLNFRYKSIGKQTGSGVYEYFENGVGKLPIPEISMAQQLPIIKLVDSITENKQKQTDYTKLLEKAKDENNFEREIQIEKELEQIAKNIAQTDKEIDQMVYELYGLSDEEINIVEGN